MTNESSKMNIHFKSADLCKRVRFPNTVLDEQV